MDTQEVPRKVFILGNKIFCQKDAYRELVEQEELADNLPTSEERIKVYSQLIEKYPDYPLEYNNRAFELRKIGEFKKALEDINKAIFIIPYGLYVCTRAEIYGAMGEREKFYKDIVKALEFKFPVWEYLDDEAYEKYKDEEEFKNLIKEAQDKNIEYKEYPIYTYE